MSFKVTKEQAVELASKPDITGEFKEKVGELTRRLNINGFNYERDWGTMAFTEQQAFIEGLFLDGLSANNVDEYVASAAESCGCPDVAEELQWHSPKLIGAIEKQQVDAAKIHEGFSVLEGMIDSFSRNLLVEAGEAEVVEEARLDFPMFVRQPSRLAVLIKKIENEEPFQIEGSEEEVLLKKDPKLIALLGKLRDKGGFSLEDVQKILGPYSRMFPTADGKGISLRKLHKTAEFGGKSSESGTEKEDFAKGELQKLIQAAISNNDKQPITVRLLSQKGELLETFDGIVGVRSMGKVNGMDPKTDFILYGEDGDKIYISHKDGSAPKSFGQWGGVTKKAGQDIFLHPEVVDFIKTLRSKLEVVNRDEEGNPIRWEYPRGLSYGRVIKDARLKMLAMFGNEYDPAGEGGVENVDVVAQGPFEIQKTDTQGVYNLSAYHLMVRKDLDGDFDEGYAPTLVTRFASGRANYGINNMRVGMYPRDNRKIHEWV